MRSLFLFPTLGLSVLIQGKTFSIQEAVPSRQSATPLVTSPHVLTLNKKSLPNGSARRSAGYILGHTSHSIKIPNSTHNNDLVPTPDEEAYLTDITIGTNTYQVIVDTGSSDTWIIQSGFTCVNVSNLAPEPEENCNFGPTYDLSETFTLIPDENFSITYGDSNALTGIMGCENVTIAGLTVEQEIAVVNYAAYAGDGASSGVLGLAYPSITSAFNGTDPSLDPPVSGHIIYPSIFTTLTTTAHLIPPVFSLAISRPSTSGPSPPSYLSLGGLPPVPITSALTSTPLLISTYYIYPTSYLFYTINIHALLINDRSLPHSGHKTQYIVDSGTTLNYLPAPLALAISDAFAPPGVLDRAYGGYRVARDAAPPRVGIDVRGRVLHVDGKDMILRRAGWDELGGEVCISGFSTGGEGAPDEVFILGDVFLKNVVAVFDVGAAEMRFAAREEY